MAHVESVQLGGIKTYQKQTAKGKMPWQSAFDKQPVQVLEIRKTSIVGDEQADTKHHGGTDKAVLIYAAKHYQDWRNTYPDMLIGPGGLGENITVSDIDESMVNIGDIYRIGTVLLEISQPRVPCWKISERWQQPSFTDEVTKTGKTGWYARVLEDGQVENRDSVELLKQGNAKFTIQRLNNLLFRREPFTAEVIDELVNDTALAAAWKENLPRELMDL